ncbi:MAG TPA: hypothetical protein VIC85_08620 [Ktedonobacterales bacterium]|jgi:hypothetical protein
MVLTALLLLAGAFTLCLGLVHVILPALLDYRAVILDRDPPRKPPRPFHLRPTRYVVSLADRYGIVWIMNHAASYGLISIGLLDLLASGWLRGDPGRLVALWIAGWWFVRAASQLYLGRRLGDWLLLAWFAGLGLIHVGVWLS